MKLRRKNPDTVQQGRGKYRKQTSASSIIEFRQLKKNLEKILGRWCKNGLSDRHKASMMFKQQKIAIDKTLLRRKLKEVSVIRTVSTTSVAIDGL